MNRTRLYIADIDPVFVAGVRRAVAHCREIEVVGTSSSGAQALNAIIRQRPDVLLTDLQLLELDGIALLRELCRLRRPPSVIVCTRFYSGASMDSACRHGASYFLCKPVEPEQLPRLILECHHGTDAPREDGDEVREDSALAVWNLLKQCGLSPRLSGSAYLAEAVLLARDNPLLLKNLSMGLYAELAARQDTTVSRVERSLRNAIAIGFDRGALSGRFSRRPTNREFIAYMLRQIDGDKG